MSTAVDRIHVDRWSGGLAGAIVIAVAGLLAGSTVLIVAAAIPVVYVVYGAVDSVDVDPSTVSVERELGRESAFPGDRVGVTVRVTNEGKTALSDVRVADQVPREVSVVDGRDRRALSLRPGETGTLEYTVVARRGEHEFGPVGIRLRSTSGTDVLTLEVVPEGSTQLTCRPDLEFVPLDRRTRQFVGTVATDTAGPGVEFHSTREYRAGDPVSRIDWRRLAKSGDLTTVNYREHRSARVVVAVDARDPCYVAPVEGAPTGAAICGYGARRVFDVLRGAGHEVGAAGFGLRNGGNSGPAWVEPGTGEETRIRSYDVFDTATETPRHLQPGRIPRGQFASETHGGPRSGRNPPGGSPSVARDGGPPGSKSARRGEASARWDDPPGRNRGGNRDSDRGHHGPRERRDRSGRASRRGRRDRRGPNSTTTTPSRGSSDGDGIDSLFGRFSPETQLVLLTPALEEYPVSVVRTAIAYGHRVTVISPDVTTAESTGGRLQNVERQLVLEEMRGAGARVVDWDRERPLALTLASLVEGI